VLLQTPFGDEPLQERGDRRPLQAGGLPHQGGGHRTGLAQLAHDVLGRPGKPAAGSGVDPSQGVRSPTTGGMLSQQTRITQVPERPAAIRAVSQRSIAALPRRSRPQAMTRGAPYRRLVAEPELARLELLQPTYDEVGATDGVPPPGYRHVHRREVVGMGREAFAAAADALVGWRVHRAAGLRVTASGPATAVGVVVAQRFGVGPLGLDAPCRVVAVVDEPAARGFAYGTLPGHPESGEERFVVRLHRPGTEEPTDSDEATASVTAEITTFWRPVTVLSRLGGPLTRVTQRLVTDRYLAALRAAASGDLPS